MIKRIALIDIFIQASYSKYRSCECCRDGSTAQKILVRAPVFGVLAKINLSIYNIG
jgi:hypothetical protein